MTARPSYSSVAAKLWARAHIYKPHTKQHSCSTRQSATLTDSDKSATFLAALSAYVGTVTKRDFFLILAAIEEFTVIMSEVSFLVNLVRLCVFSLGYAQSVS